jgi:major membrane immunogen (membrane-anchored lipoprotein)
MDTVVVTVKAAANIAPTAHAGSGQSITLPQSTVTLTGSGTDQDGSISAYSWSKISGPSAFNITNPASAVTTVSQLVDGTYQFELKVTDNKGAFAKDTIQITVNKANLVVTPPVGQNMAPIADAGRDTTAVAPVTSITFNGTGSDADGTIAGYSWTQVSGPSNSTLSASNTPSATLTNLTAGTYEFELKVTDNEGATGRDTVKVTIALDRTAQESNTALKVYPNPVRTVASVEFITQDENTNINIRVTNVMGTAVYQKQFVTSSKNVTEQIDMSNLTKGIYTISVYFDGMERQSIKVIKL